MNKTQICIEDNRLKSQLRCHLISRSVYDKKIKAIHKLWSEPELPTILKKYKNK